MQVWPMAEARAQPGERVHCANETRPQEITVHDRSAAVVLSLTVRYPGGIAFAARPPARLTSMGKQT